MKTKGALKKQEPSKTKEDHLAPTPLPQRTGSKKPTREDGNLSDKELQERIDNRSRIGGKTKDFFKSQSMLREYRKEKQELEQNRVQKVINYGLGPRVGLSQTPLHQLNDVDAQIDQKRINKFDHMSKDYYEKNNSLQRTFPSPRKQAFDKGKNKGISRDR